MTGPERVDFILAPEMTHHVIAAEAMQAGLAAHGIACSLLSASEIASAAPVVSVWGWRLGSLLRATGRDVLVLEHGFIGNRREWISTGWNGLNGRARFPRCRDRGRFELLHGDLFRSWRPYHPGSGGYTLLIGQVPGDMSLEGCDFPAWAQRAVDDAAAVFDLPVRFRPHPMAEQYGITIVLDGAETLHGTLQAALDGAAIVVTFNSNAGVESILAGKPTLVFDDRSMAWPMGGTHVWKMPQEPVDRWGWAAALAWSQFSWDEIRSGFAWECAAEVLCQSGPSKSKDSMS